MQHKKYVAGQCSTSCLPCLPKCPVKTEGRMKDMNQCGPSVPGHSWGVLDCFIRKCYINCAVYSLRDEGTLLSWRVLKPMVLLDSAFCEHFKAGVLGTILNFALVFSMTNATVKVLSISQFSFQTKTFILGN